MRTEASEWHSRERALAIFPPLTLPPIRRHFIWMHRDRLSRFRSSRRSQ